MKEEGNQTGNDERRSRTGDGSHCQPFPSSTSCTALQINTNLTGHDHPKTPSPPTPPHSMSDPPPSLIPLRIYHPFIPNSSSLLCFSSSSPFLFIAPCSLILIPPPPPPQHHHHLPSGTHANFSPTSNTSAAAAEPALPAGSLKTSLSREEGKVVFCLISLLSPMWRKQSYRQLHRRC